MERISAVEYDRREHDGKVRVTHDRNEAGNWLMETLDGAGEVIDSVRVESVPQWLSYVRMDCVMSTSRTID